MRPYRESGLGRSSNSGRHHRLSFAGMWDDDEDLLHGVVTYNHKEHQPVAIHDTDDNDDEDDVDDSEHDFIDMKRRSFLMKRRDVSKDQAVVDIEVDKIFDEVFTDRRTETARKPPIRGSMISVAFANDEVYDGDGDDDDDDDYFDDDDDTTTAYKNAKVGEMNLLHDNISNSVFYGFMLVSICLVLYMVFLMFTVEADEPNAVANYVINHTKHEHPHPTVSDTDSPQTPSSKDHKSWEHVFEDGDEDSSVYIKGNRPDKDKSIQGNPDDTMIEVQIAGHVNQTIELGKAMHVAEQIYDSDRQKKGSTGTNESHPEKEHMIGSDNRTGALGKAMQIAETTFDSNRPKVGSNEVSHQDGKQTASGNQNGALGKAMQIAEQTFDNKQQQGGSTEDSHRNEEPIGFLEAPPKLEELLVLLHTNTGREMPNSSLDTTNHQQRVNDDGSILHCGVKVEGTLVTVECLLGDELCGVYLGSYRCGQSNPR